MATLGHVRVARCLDLGGSVSGGSTAPWTWAFSPALSADPSCTGGPCA